MKKSVRQVRLFLLLDAFFILFCIPGIYHINQKADIPFTINKSGDFFIVDKTQDFIRNIQSGDTLVSVDGKHFSKREEIEIYLDSKSIGDQVLIVYLHQGLAGSVHTNLIEFYNLSFIISNSCVGILFIVFAIFVLLKCPEYKPAKIFHWGNIGIAVILLYTWGKYTISPFGLGVAVRVLFQFAYVLAPAAFLHFALAFPKDRQKRFKNLITAVYAIGVAIAVINIYFFIWMLPSLTETVISNYLFAFDFNRIFAIFNILTAISIFIISYKRTVDEVEKKKLKWLLTGFIVGPFSFIALWAIPQIITSYGLIPEILLPFLMTSIPITFTIAIVRYHIMDIDLLIRRSVVYSIVIIFLIIIYIAIISVISNRILTVNNTTPSIIAAIIVTLLFEPLRRRVQLYVDKKFFRVQYNFREALKEFIKNISELNNVQYLADAVVQETQEFIPVEKLGFFLLKNDRIKLIAHRNFDLLVNRSLKFDKGKLKSDLSNPVANPVKVEAGVNFESADLATFKRWGMDLVIPVKSVSGEIYAFMVLGGKKSGTRFTIEDLDLLYYIASNIASTLSRIYLQEELIRKNLETERLEELNKQKTLFVSTVSHDLKTPLASIKVFSEILKNDRQISEKQKNYLDIIEGETDRLTRLINNVLGFAWIEKGTRDYSFESISLNAVVQRTLDILSYQLKMQGFRVEKEFSPVNWIISADPDAVMEALINIISNAIKFSIKHKVIFISTFRSSEYICVEVRDKGIGIKSEDLKNLFKPFFRSQIAGNKKISGTGLGLSIIKHVMDAHKGRIEVESIPDEGTSFVLKFPIEVYDDAYLHHQNLISSSLQEQEGQNEKDINNRG